MHKYSTKDFVSESRAPLILFRLRGLCNFFYLFATLLCFGSACTAEDDAKKVKRLVAEIKAKGEPVSGSEMKSTIRLAPGEENVTHLWMEGFAAIEGPLYHSAKATLPFVGVPKKGFEPIAGQPWPSLDRAARFLERHEGALAKFHEAARRKGKSRFPAWEADLLYPKLDWRTQATEAIKLLQLEFEVRVRQRDFPGAAKSLLAMLSLTYTDETYPQTGDLRASAGKQIIDQIQRGEFSDDDLKRFQSVLRGYTPNPGMRIYLLGSRAGLIDLFTEAEKGLDKVDDESRKGFYARYAFRLEHINRILLTLEVPRQKWPAELVKAQSESMESLNQIIQQYPLPSSSLIDIVGLGIEQPLHVCQAAAGLDMHFQFADIWIAVELYRRANGKLPESFDALVPQYLPAIPLGPDGVNPLILKASDKGYIISIDAEGKPGDGGKPDAKIGDEDLFFPVR